MELSFDLMKQFMRNAPVNIFFKDTECKYLFASEICSLVYADEDGGITGKTDLEIQSIPELGRFYYEDDKKILATGEDSHYISLKIGVKKDAQYCGGMNLFGSGFGDYPQAIVMKIYGKAEPPEKHKK